MTPTITLTCGHKRTVKVPYVAIGTLVMCTSGDQGFHFVTVDDWLAN